MCLPVARPRDVRQRLTVFFTKPPQQSTTACTQIATQKQWAIFESTTRTVAQGARLSAVSASPTTDDVIFCGNAMSTNEHPGNQLFKLLIQKCIKDLPQDTHSVEDIAQAFWDCHKPRKFFEWDNDAARYSRLCSSDTLYIIKYALNEEARLAFSSLRWSKRT
ncbi:hypothetical protein MHU86_18046 [Fragilaria crotonensis]|nr:hypothetical protein MHU86_18046 [Fragilaria crotonensis]